MANPYGRMTGAGPDVQLPEWVQMGDGEQPDIAQSMSPMMDMLRMKIGAARAGGGLAAKGGASAGDAGKAMAGGAQSL